MKIPQWDVSLVCLGAPVGGPEEPVVKVSDLLAWCAIQERDPNLLGADHALGRLRAALTPEGEKER